MKIIKEIEKSRLTEDGMNGIKGGISVGENCSADVLYRSCASSNGQLFQVSVCPMKLSCPSQYACCSGPKQYDSCNTTTMYVRKYK